MRPTTSNEIRQAFLDYFNEQQHEVVASAPLPQYDNPTLLFTNAGMNQFVDVFFGAGETAVHPCRHRPKSDARPGQTQRSGKCRSLAAPPHLLRDVGQLLLWRLLQKRGDRFCLAICNGCFGVGKKNGCGQPFSPTMTNRLNCGSAICLRKKSCALAKKITFGRWARLALAAPILSFFITLATWQPVILPG